jgi:hypothetical protein
LINVDTMGSGISEDLIEEEIVVQLCQRKGQAEDEQRAEKEALGQYIVASAVLWCQETRQKKLLAELR